MPSANYTIPNLSTAEAVTGSSGENVTNKPEEDPRINPSKLIILKILTYLGGAVAILGICLTILSYIGYRKFHVKRPHIVMVNLCSCLLLYYLAYLISNPVRLNPEQQQNDICLFGAVVDQFAILAAWSWILVYWTLVLVMYRRPMGGHISHFFIKASFPAYGIPLITTVVCAVAANCSGDMKGTYYGEMCFVVKLYYYLGVMLPIAIMFVPILCVFVIIMRGVICAKDERLKESNSRRNVQRHFVRLTIVTLLLETVAWSGFTQRKRDLFATMIVFGVVSSLLGLALMVLFCLHHEEIREHWISIIRGKDESFRKRSISRSSKYEIGSTTSSSRKAQTLKKSSLFVDSHNDERMSSTYRIVAKEDTDMSTLGLIQIPGTPTTERNDAGDNSRADGTEVRRKKSDVSSKSKKHDHRPREHKESLADIKENETFSSKLSKKKSLSSSTQPVSSRPKAPKRQQTSDAILVSTAGPNGTSQQVVVKKRSSKRGNPAQRLSRFSRKSTSTIDEESC